MSLRSTGIYQYQRLKLSGLPNNHAVFGSKESYRTLVGFYLSELFSYVTCLTLESIKNISYGLLCMTRKKISIESNIVVHLLNDNFVLTPNA